jgi:ABC-type uncharacterized transport system substrate-binding protein
LKRIGILLLLLCATTVMANFATQKSAVNIFEPPAKVSGEIKKFKMGYTESTEYANYAATFYNVLLGLKELGWIETLDGIPYKPGQNEATAMWQWLCINQPSTYIEFVSDAFYKFDGDQTVMAAAYKRTHEKAQGIDMMLTFGTLAGKTLTKTTPEIPVLVFSTSNALASEIIASATDSGKDNVWAHIDPKRYQKQVTVMHDIFKFKKLGIIYEDTVEGRSYADLKNVKEVCQSLGIQLIERHVTENVTPKEYPRYKKDMSAAFIDLSDEVDAFYLTAGNLNPSDLPELFKPFYTKKIPVISQLGGEEVEKGAVMSTASNFIDLGRYGAQIVIRSLKGENPRKLEYLYEDVPYIVLNLNVANKIGYKPEFEILLIADKVYFDPKSK